MPASSIAQTAQQLQATVNPRMAGALSPAEAPILTAAANLNPVEKFGDVSDLYSNTSAAIRALQNSSDPAASQAIRRLTILKGSIRQGMADAAQGVADQEAPQVAAGTLAPADSIVGRFQALKEDDLAAQQSVAQVAAGGSPGAGAVGRAGGGSAGYGGSDGAEGAPVGRFGNASGNPGLALSASPASRPQSLAAFLISRGGVKDPGGDLAAMDANLARPTLYRKNGGGMLLDYAREAAAEAGYIHPDSGTNDLLDALSDELHGRKVYTPEDAGDRMAAGMGGDPDREAAARDQARSAVLDAEESWGGALHPDEVDHATGLVLQGAHPQEAIEDAARATMERELGTNASRLAFSSNFGVAPDAVQGVADLLGGGNGLVANMDAGAADRYAAARAKTVENKGTFAAGPVGQVLAPGRNGAPFRVLASKVPSTLFSTPEGVQGYLKAVADVPGGEALARDYLAYALKQAGVTTAETGARLNPATYGKWLAARAPILKRFPGLFEQFSTPLKAQAALDAVQGHRDQLGKMFRDAMGDSPSTTLARYIKPGGAGADAMDRFTRETGNSPQAAAAMGQELAASLRGAAVKDGVLDPAAYAKWADKYRPALSRRPDIAAQFGDAAKAQESVTQAIAARDAALKDYQGGAARFWLKNEPSTAIGKALASPKPVEAMRDMASLVKGDPDAIAGLQHAVMEHVAAETLPNTEAGPRFSNTRYQNLMRDSRPALAQVLEPGQLARMDAAARALAASGHSGKAMSLLRAVASSVGTTGLMLAGEHAQGFAGALVGRGIGEGAENWLHGLRQSNTNRVNDLLIGAYKDPQLAAALVQHATPDRLPGLAQRAGRRLAQTAGVQAGVQAGQSQPPPLSASYAGTNALARSLRPRCRCSRSRTRSPMSAGSSLADVPAWLPMMQLYDGTGAHVGGLHPPLAVNNVLTDAFHANKALRPAWAWASLKPWTPEADVAFVWMLPIGMAPDAPLPIEVVAALVQAIDAGGNVMLHGDSADGVARVHATLRLYCGGGHA